MSRPVGSDSAGMHEKYDAVQAGLVARGVLPSSPKARHSVNEILEENGYPTMSDRGITYFMRKLRVWCPTDDEIRSQGMAVLRLAEERALEEGGNIANLNRVAQTRLAYAPRPEPEPDTPTAKEARERYGIR